MRPVSLAVLAPAPFRKTYMSRAALGADGSERFADHRSNGVFGDIFGTRPGAFNQGVDLFIGKGLKHLIKIGRAHV